MSSIFDSCKNEKNFFFIFINHEAGKNGFGIVCQSVPCRYLGYIPTQSGTLNYDATLQNHQNGVPW